MKSSKEIKWSWILSNVYVYDLETITCEWTLNPYAAGYLYLGNIKGDIEEWHRWFVRIEYGLDCLKNMLYWINDTHLPRKVIKKIKGEQIEMNKKEIIIMFAHNGKGFDSYHFMINDYLNDP